MCARTYLLPTSKPTSDENVSMICGDSSTDEWLPFPTTYLFNLPKNALWVRASKGKGLGNVITIFGIDRTFDDKRVYEEGDYITATVSREFLYPFSTLRMSLDLWVKVCRESPSKLNQSFDIFNMRVKYRVIINNSKLMIPFLASHLTYSFLRLAFENFYCLQRPDVRYHWYCKSNINISRYMNFYCLINWTVYNFMLHFMETPASTIASI